MNVFLMILHGQAFLTVKHAIWWWLLHHDKYLSLFFGLRFVTQNVTLIIGATHLHTLLVGDESTHSLGKLIIFFLNPMSPVRNNETYMHKYIWTKFAFNIFEYLSSAWGCILLITKSSVTIATRVLQCRNVRINRLWKRLPYTFESSCCN